MLQISESGAILIENKLIPYSVSQDYDATKVFHRDRGYYLSMPKNRYTLSTEEGCREFEIDLSDTLLFMSLGLI